MALRQCPDCMREVSPSAKSCPHCGCRLKGIHGLIRFIRKKLKELRFQFSHASLPVRVAIIGLASVTAFYILARGFVSFRLSVAAKDLWGAARSEREMAEDIRDMCDSAVNFQDFGEKEEAYIDSKDRKCALVGIKADLSWADRSLDRWKPVAPIFGYTAKVNRLTTIRKKLNTYYRQFSNKDIASDYYYDTYEDDDVTLADIEYYCDGLMLELELLK